MLNLFYIITVLTEPSRQSTVNTADGTFSEEVGRVKLHRYPGNDSSMEAAASSQYGSFYC